MQSYTNVVSKQSCLIPMLSHNNAVSYQCCLITMLSHTNTVSYQCCLIPIALLLGTANQSVLFQHSKATLLQNLFDTGSNNYDLSDLKRTYAMSISERWKKEWNSRIRGIHPLRSDQGQQDFLLWGAASGTASDRWRLRKAANLFWQQQLRGQLRVWK